MASEYIQCVGHNLLRKLNSDPEFKKQALKSISSFKKFEVIQPVEGENERILEASLALIGCKLLNEMEGKAIQTIFSIMDDSGDGKLQAKEIMIGLNKCNTDYTQNLSAIEEIQDEEPTEDDLNKGEDILKKVDTDGNGEIDYKDFLIACVNYTDPESFLNYMANAYKEFFDNDAEAADA